MWWDTQEAKASRQGSESPDPAKNPLKDWNLMRHKEIKKYIQCIPISSGKVRCPRCKAKKVGYHKVDGLKDWNVAQCSDCKRYFDIDRYIAGGI